MTHPVILDLETQYAFQEVGNDTKKLKVSVAGIYDYAAKTFKVYWEHELSRLFTRLEYASLIIGFNIRKFDLPVLSPYYVGNISQFPTLDILEEVEKVLGFRVALDDLVRATLSMKKSGHGLLAINYFKNREWNKLKNYCLDDVKITKELYEYGKINRRLYFLTSKGKQEIPVSFNVDKRISQPVSLSLPF